MLAIIFSACWQYRWSSWLGELVGLIQAVYWFNYATSTVELDKDVVNGIIKRCFFGLSLLCGCNVQRLRTLFNSEGR